MRIENRAPALRPHAFQLHRWVLTEPVHYILDDEGEIMLKPGLISDLKSSPWMLWPMVGPPMRDWRLSVPALLHDQLYKVLGFGVFTRLHCDELFYQALRVMGVNRFHAYVLYLGTRVGGWVGWNSYARNPAEVHRQQEYIEWQTAQKT